MKSVLEGAVITVAVGRESPRLSPVVEDVVDVIEDVTEVAEIVELGRRRPALTTPAVPTRGRRRIPDRLRLRLPSLVLPSLVLVLVPRVLVHSCVVFFVCEHLGERRYQIRRRLTAAGRRARDDVPARERQRDGVPLNRREGHEPAPFPHVPRELVHRDV